MASHCFPMVRGRVMRVTRLDGCGAIAAGACANIVSDGFVSVAFTANVEEGDTITVTNAAGRICVRDAAVPTMTGYNLVITFCEVNPDLYAMITGQSVVVDGGGDTVGFRVNGNVDSSQSGFALEIWTNVPGTACTTAGQQGTWGYLLIPFIQGGVLGDFTIENGAVTFTIQNAVTKQGNVWGKGPYNVVAQTSGGAAGPLLTSLDTADFLHVQLTTIAPPADSCSCNASGPKSTGATAGTPGTYTPVNSYPPDKFSSVATWGLTASPTTNWTTGQYMVLGDGSFMNWNGTAWVAGKHP